jgi:hypothetical protein
MDMHNCLEPMRQLLVAFRRDNGRPGQQHQRCRQRPEDTQQPVLSTDMWLLGARARPRADIGDISVGARPLSLVD